MHLHDKLEFLKKDFLMLTEKLKENYRPSDLSSLANIGVVYMALECMLDEKMHTSHNPYSQDEKTYITQNPIEDELNSAEAYYRKWQETKDPTYRQMMHDELRHADFLIKHTRMTANGNEQGKIKAYIDWYNKLMAY